MADAGSIQREEKSKETATVPLASKYSKPFQLNSIRYPGQSFQYQIFKTFSSTFVKLIRHEIDPPDALCSYSYSLDDTAGNH
jgi:hypothetical protein